MSSIWWVLNRLLDFETVFLECREKYVWKRFL